jgi:hypothetical protein
VLGRATSTICCCICCEMVTHIHTVTGTTLGIMIQPSQHVVLPILDRKRHLRADRRSCSRHGRAAHISPASHWDLHHFYVR